MADSAMPPIEPAEGGRGCRLRCYIQPRASRNAVAGWHDHALKIALTAPPVEGAANAALIAFLADFFGIPKSAVKLVAGQASRRKTVELAMVSPDDARMRLPPI